MGREESTWEGGRTEGRACWWWWWWWCCCCCCCLLLLLLLPLPPLHAALLQPHPTPPTRAPPCHPPPPRTCPCSVIRYSVGPLGATNTWSTFWGLRASPMTGASPAGAAWGGRNTKVRSQLLTSHTRTVASAPAEITCRGGGGVGWGPFWKGGGRGEAGEGLRVPGTGWGAEPGPRVLGPAALHQRRAPNEPARPPAPRLPSRPLR